MYQSSSGQTATGVAEYQGHIKPELDCMAVFLPLFTPRPRQGYDERERMAYTHYKMTRTTFELYGLTAAKGFV